MHPNEFMTIVEQSVHWKDEYIIPGVVFDVASEVNSPFNHQISKIETMVAIQEIFGRVKLPCDDFDPLQNWG
jgi:hypothetical protein